MIRLDIIVVPIQYFYPALMHFTGSGDFNQKLRLQYEIRKVGVLKFLPNFNCCLELKFMSL